MKRHFIADGEFARNITRSRALGCTALDLTDIEVGQAVDFKTNGSTIELHSTDSDESENPAYTILCKEFGVFGGNKNFSSKVSILHCDNGWMLVTLWEGAIIIKLDGKLMMPSTGVDTTPNVTESDILWVNCEKVQGYAKYLNHKAPFVYDFEFMYIIKGFISSGMKSFSMKHVDDEDIDISAGQFLMAMQKKEQEKQAKEAKRLCKSFNFGTNQSLEFEDEDEDDEEDDDEDDDVYY